MGIIWWLLVGVAAGVVAKFVFPGRDTRGPIVPILLGAGGAVIGGYIATVMGIGTVGNFDTRTFVIALIGASTLLMGLRLIEMGATA